MSGTMTWVEFDVHARSTQAAAIDTMTGELSRMRFGPGIDGPVAWLGELPGPVRACYEAGPTGFGLYRAATAAGIAMQVIAPGKTPRGPSDKVKTDRKDAELLARLLLAGSLTSAGMDTGSYHEFAEGYFLTAPAMAWFWDQYLPEESRRSESLVSPVNASSEDLAGLPPALVINGEADVLRDEGEAYATKLRAAGVPVTATRYGGIIHDFVMLHPLADTHAARAATEQGAAFLRDALHGS